MAVASLPSSYRRRNAGSAAPLLLGAEWQARGIKLIKLNIRSQWALGDWWNEGHAYGARRQFVEDWGGLQFQTLENYGWVAGSFEISRRREHLPFAHHAELAGLEPEQADELLDWCEEQRRVTGRCPSRNELRMKVQETNDVLITAPPNQEVITGGSGRSPTPDNVVSLRAGRARGR